MTQKELDRYDQLKNHYNKDPKFTEFLDLYLKLMDGEHLANIAGNHLNRLLLMKLGVAELREAVGDKFWEVEKEVKKCQKK